jgi:hypothetical protein
MGLVLAVVGSPLLEHGAWRWSLPAMVVAVTLGYGAFTKVSPRPQLFGLLALAAVAVRLIVIAVLRAS